MVFLRDFTRLFLLVLFGARAFAADGILDVYAKALAEDPRVNIARYQVDIGEAQKDAAFGGLLPQVNATGQYSENRIDEGSEGLNAKYPGERYSLQVRQVLLNWRSMAANSRSQKVLDQREAELLDTLGQLSVDVSERYFNVLLADDNVALLETERDLLEKQVEEFQALYEKRLVRITDVLDTQARADTLRIELIGAENNAALAREELALLTGSPVEALRSLRDDFVLPELTGVLSEWVDSALATNPLLKSKEYAVSAARSGVEEGRSGLLPTVDLVLSRQYSNVGFDNLATPPRDIDYIGIDVRLPLFAGGANSAKLRESWSRYYLAQEEQEAVRREVLKRVRSAWLNASAGQRRMEAAKLSVKSSEIAYKAIEKALELGTARNTELLEALHNRTLAQRDYRRALYDYVFAWVSLQRESGELDASHMETIEAQVLEDN
jgi:outer membrane protein